MTGLAQSRKPLGNPASPPKDPARAPSTARWGMGCAPGFVVLGALFGSQDMMYIGADASRLVGAVCIAAGIALGASFSRPVLTVFLGVVCGVLLMQASGSGRGFLYASGALAACLELYRRDGRSSAAVALTPLILWSLLLDMMPAFWMIVQSTSDRFSGALTNESFVGGMTPLGVPVLLGVLGVAITMQRGSWFAIASRLLCISAVWFAVMLYMQSQVVPATMRALIGTRWFGGPARWATMGFLACAVPMFVGVSAVVLLSVVRMIRDRSRFTSGTEEHGPAVAHRRRVLIAVCALLAGGGVLLRSLPEFLKTRSAAPAHVYFHTNGLSDFSVPDWERMGQIRSGMFGLFERRLQRRGIQTHAIDTLVELDHADSGVVVVINPFELSQEEIDAFYRYVAAGNGAMVLGDHTDLSGSKEPTNRLLSPLGVRLEVDSAFPVSGGWESKLSPPVHWSLAGSDVSNIRVQWSTGASLHVESVNAMMQPLLCGRYVFSDAADFEMRRGDLRGDYRYQPGESIGDRLLALACTHGRGRVLVYGDTSTFQNIALPWAWPLVARHVALASAPVTLWQTLLALCAPAIVLIGIGVALFLPQRSSAIACCWISIAIGYGLHHAIVSYPVALERAGDAPYAIVDPSYASDATYESWKSNSLNGLLLSLERAGFEPHIAIPGQLSPSPARPDLRVVLDPRHMLPTQQFHRIMQELDSGTITLLSVSGESRFARSNQARKMGFVIDDVPLGPVPILPKTDSMRFTMAMLRPQMTEAYQFHPITGDWHPHFIDSGHWIVAERIEGSGRLVVIADPIFLLDRSLESEMEAWPGNLDLLRTLIRPHSISGMGE